MTPRKELFIEIQKALKTIKSIELVDLYRGQFENQKESYPTQFTCALIHIGTIDYESMVENCKQGLAEITIYLYIKDGWLDQHFNTSDNENGLIEIDLIDEVISKLEFLKGDNFKPLQLIQEDENDITDPNIMSFCIRFNSRIYRQINYQITKMKKLTLKPKINGIFK